MPADNPQFGEVWSMMGPATDSSSPREVLGIIAEVNDSFILLVSLIGNRVRIPRSGLRTWTYRSAPGEQAGHHRCGREGCVNPGILVYDLHTTCPRHLPMGVSASIAVPGLLIPNQSLQRTIPCPNCSNQDPVEDFRQGERSLWICTFCSRSFALVRPGTDLSAVLGEFNGFGLRGERAIFGGACRAAHSEWVSQPRAIPAVLAEDTSEMICVVLGGMMTIRPPEPRRAVQRLGGQPNRSVSDTAIWQPASPPARPLPRPRTRVNDEEDDRIRNVLRSLPDDFQIIPEDELPVPTAVVEGARWVQRKSGIVVEIVRLEHSQDEERTQIVVYRPADADSSTQRMVTTDFTRFHRPYTDVLDQSPSRSVPPVQLTIGEEWTSLEGDLVVILGVDTRKESVLVEVAGSKQRKSINLTQFAGARWRRVIRKSAYDRLLDDDAFEEA